MCPAEVVKVRCRLTLNVPYTLESIITNVIKFHPPLVEARTALYDGEVDSGLCSPYGTVASERCFKLPGGSLA